MRAAHALLSIVALALPGLVCADRARYSGVVDLSAASESLTVRHHHDWSLVSDRLTFSPETPFGVDANVSSLEFVSRGRAPVRISSPPLTYLHVTADSRYVVGMSSIKLNNVVHLIVFDRNATVLMRRHISPEVYRLGPQEYRELRAAYPKHFADMDTSARITQIPYVWREAGFVYMDPWNLSDVPDSTALRNALPAFRIEAPYSFNIGETVTNFVIWFDGKNPAVRVVEANGVPVSLKLRDSKGVEMSFPFNLALPDA